MKWLARLKSQKSLEIHATKPTKPPEQAGWVSSVGFVAYPPTPFQKIEASEVADNDSTTTPTADPDRWCWPHSPAMNGQEIDTFTARLARFNDKGLILADAEQQADRLVIRDREGDDRVLCLECSHLQGMGRWRCNNWAAADTAREALSPDLVQMLQRCSGYRHILNDKSLGT